MKRAALALVATVAGLVLLLGFKSQSPAAAKGIALPSTPTGGGGSGSGSGSSSGSSSSASSSGSVGSAAATSGTRSATGQAIETAYGPVQVRITEVNGKITKVTPVQLPNTYSRDFAIDQYAVPQLIQETMQSQSANIQMVSGASYTSQGYIDSLQSAIDQLR